MNQIADGILAWAKEKGFESPTSIEDPMVLAKLMLVVTEVAEAAEGARDHDRQNVAEELADTIIRIFHLAAGLKIDICLALEAKMKHNETRPIQHGRKSSV
jgi:NTP pyrophosphatase (non-canonical NTP hydrolase)